ncbi:hypothetical protein N665_0532s0003 [Sinapis alba]|nr:hypothetical protein N665_0532s0003 [Sinapis alba]
MEKRVNQWNDSMVHIFLEIYENEMEKINWRTGPLKKESKTRIRNAFREATGQNQEWLPLKNKFYSINSCTTFIVDWAVQLEFHFTRPQKLFEWMMNGGPTENSDSDEDEEHNNTHVHYMEGIRDQISSSLWDSR